MKSECLGAGAFAKCADGVSYGADKFGQIFASGDIFAERDKMGFVLKSGNGAV